MTNKNNTVLLIGDTGMLGQAVRKRLEDNGENVIGASRSSKDFSVDLLDDKNVEICFTEAKPGIVINASGLISIDGCESNPDMAYRLNGRLPGILADYCKKYHAYFVQVSTDHYYSGDHNGRHKETDPMILVNEYARSKYAGECFSLLYPNTLVLRTNVIGFRGKGADTFIEWVIHAIENEDKLELYDDFYTSSINSPDFARILTDILKKKPVGIYNLGASYVSSKKDFIITLAKELFGFIPPHTTGSVHDISRSNRADSLGLDTKKIETLLGYRMPSLEETVQSIKSDYLKRKEHHEI
ncbi:MAG: SDR family oxidoreductase [Roseburia sp.]|jgi:dTDP-4-dehydrorhamnose reductase|nr:SDR family oxidoreductase [Roseburia sp.]